MEQKRKKNDQRYERKRTGMRNILRHRDMVWHTYNPSTWEEVQVQHHPYITDSMSLKPAWVHGTVKEIKKGKRKEKERRKGVRKEGKDCTLVMVYSRGWYKSLQNNLASLGYKTPCLKKKEGRKGHVCIRSLQARSIPILGRGVQSLELACEVLSSSSLSQEWKPLVMISSVNRRLSVRRKHKRLLRRNHHHLGLGTHLRSLALSGV